jgi:hypothetical protein
MMERTEFPSGTLSPFAEQVESKLKDLTRIRETLSGLIDACQMQ